jgi:hypothetical protein
MEWTDDRPLMLATVLYLLFLPLYPITASLMDEVTSTTVIAVATAVNVAVTMVYAYFTWRLWQETRREAELTGQQAVQTREIFEATNRPWLSIEPFQEFAFDGGSVKINFRLRNHGTSPAFVTHWIKHWDLPSPEDVLRLTDSPGEQVSWCIFPNGEGRARQIEFGDPRGAWNRGSRFLVGVRYHGPDQRPHSTRLVAILRVTGIQDFRLEDVSHQAT